MDLARSQLGTTETGTNHVVYNQWYYGRDVSAAWCAAFVSWVLFMAGYPLPASTSKGFTYVPSGVAYAKAHGLWIPHQPGQWLGQEADLSVFSFEKQRPDHVELVEAHGPTRGSYIDIGGNTSRPGGGSQRDGGGVWRRVRESSLLGFIRPPYPADKPTPNPIPPEVEGMDFFIIRFGDAAGPGDDNPARWAWFPAAGDGAGRKTYISADALGGFTSSKHYGGELLLQESDVKAIPYLNPKTNPAS